MQANGDFSGAQKKFVEALEITHDIVNKLVVELRSLKVQFLVAPYEADAQLAYLYQKKQIDLVLTEDSDLLLFGANKCFFKMDLTGKGLEIDLTDLPKCDLFKGEIEDQHDLLLVCCILSGCDYLESIKGIGFKKAVKLVQTFGDDIRSISQELRKTG